MKYITAIIIYIVLSIFTVSFIFWISPIEAANMGRWGEAGRMIFFSGLFLYLSGIFAYSRSI